MNSCFSLPRRWYTKPRDHAADAVPRTATLAFYHIASPQRAQAQLDRQVHRDERPSLAISGAGDDAIARLSPTLVVARHGADIAVIDASRAELDDPEQLEVRYLLDALALKVAGAKVKPPPWAHGTVAAWAPIGPVEPSAGWTPVPRLVPAGESALSPVIHMIKTSADAGSTFSVLIAPLATALVFLGAWLRRREVAPAPSFRASLRKRWPYLLAGTLIGTMVLNMLFGSEVANSPIDRFGVVGAATITSDHATSIQYNSHDVIGYDVLIRTADHRVVTSRFQTDDFNVEGIGDTTVDPAPGGVFTVRYLPRYPQGFVIRNDDDSLWARKLARGRLVACATQRHDAPTLCRKTVMRTPSSTNPARSSGQQDARNGPLVQSTDEYKHWLSATFPVEPVPDVPEVVGTSRNRTFVNLLFLARISRSPTGSFEGGGHDKSARVQLRGGKLNQQESSGSSAVRYAFIAALAASSVLASTPAWAQSPVDFSAIDAKLNACSDRNPSNPGVSNCTVAATAEADRRLNRIYAAAVKKLSQPGPDFNPEIPRRLIAAERAWIAFRDAECNYKSTIALGGTGEAYAYVACRYDQTKTRMKALMAPDEPHIAR